MADWGLSALDETVSLLVTELVSNGVRHAGTSLTLAFTYDGRCLRIGVTDSDPRPPIVRAPDRMTVGGWGLALVDSLSTHWGADMAGEGGKTVWFEIDATACDGPATPDGHR